MTATLRTVRATSYLTPLREGGSLPGLVEADDDGIYVTKFRGAGQGTASLVAEQVQLDLPTQGHGEAVCQHTGARYVLHGQQ